jgi:hypothetical protein
MDLERIKLENMVSLSKCLFKRPFTWLSRGSFKKSNPFGCYRCCNSFLRKTRGPSLILIFSFPTRIDSKDKKPSKVTIKYFLMIQFSHNVLIAN